MVDLKIGGVPEHFNYPWYLTLKNKEYQAYDINLRWKDFPGGTGDMCKALRSGDIDIAIITPDDASEFPEDKVRQFVTGLWDLGLDIGHSVRNLAEAKRFATEDITIAEVLKEAGYKTGFAGKWGIGMPGTEGVPYKQGFDYAFGFYDQLRAHTFFPYHLWENDQKMDGF